ncbi:MULTISPECIES: 50S ribosomal protein L13 [Aminobacterium]|jgi:large subunit ribosomal protein L13|uniref:50S ribosomal protein L13 n=1 Tax=Aminobacterium TaxID=81466 RepID=UPI00257DD5F1|nr:MULTISPECIES: 50S ribosomal protein L13 [unclassified Aminobacterium]
MASNRTYMATREKVVREWYVVDATDKPLGRLASQVAQVLMGKHKATYTPHVDCGDFVVIINAEKVKLTGNKRQNEKRYRHTGYSGGLKSQTYGEILEKQPERLLEMVVKGMLPKTRLKMHKKLKVYAGPNHPHSAQQPKPLEF